jgi:hypothetical protein
MLAGGLAMFFLAAPVKDMFTPGKAISTGPVTAKTTDTVEHDSLCMQLIKAQAINKDTFNFQTKDTVIKIDRPLIIYKDSFVWHQQSILHIQPFDSAKCPVALLISGSNFMYKNIVFDHFRKDSVILHKPGIAGR